MNLVDLVSGTRGARLGAIRALPASDALRFALRRVLFTDAHAEVRAAAARRLGKLPGVEGWLVDALGDASPLVRDAILRALARAGTTVCAPHLRRIIDGDRMWWVRRAAIYALAAIAGEAEVPALARALADPFWRVRHAAVRVLAVVGASHPALRDDVIASTHDSSTLTFLRAAWGPVALEAPQRAAAASAVPAELLDPDPAVVTARLAAGSFEPRVFVELLCDPHVPLRSLAAQRLARSNDAPALTAALDWLEEPRIPHVVDTIHHLLDGLGDLAGELAAATLARHDRPGAARWAIAWVVATRFETLFASARSRAGADAALRPAALRLADDPTLVAWAAEDPFLVDAIAVELHERRGPAAHDALLVLDAASHPRTRALQLDVLARRGDWTSVARGLADSHHGPRAVAARWMSRTASDAAAACTSDPDPAVREAALTPEHAAQIFLRDEDPFVRRAAIATLAHAWDDTRALPAEVARATVAALADADPWVRAQACALPIDDDRAIDRVLALLGDRDEMVRAAAHDAIDKLADGDARVRARVDALDGMTRALAQAWLARSLDDVAALAAVEWPTRPPRIAPAARPAPARAAPERRAFGRAGFEVAPLAVSGAYDVSPSALARADEAGVNLYFWEPGYEVLARFLRAHTRRDRVHVVSGTYHADARSIRADVERALRKLRRETLDAFLLFWTRSPARLDDAAYDALDELRREGKIRAVGFSTHHRELAREAIEQRPWDVVMIRHSAAHPGIETALLPAARERGTAILTFSALCYGRMLSGPSAPTAAECYRYSLSQPGVTACISAPRRYHELLANLEVLTAPTLPAERIAALRAHGLGVHAESARFNTLVRQPTRDAAAAARDMLAAELPPDEARLPRRMPRPASTKRSRTRLGS